MVSRSSSARVTSDQHQSGHGSTTRRVRRRAGSVSVYRLGDISTGALRRRARSWNAGPAMPPSSILYVRSQGVRHGSPEVLARLARGEDVNAGEYTFRTTTQIETAAPQLDWLDKGVFVGVGGRRPAGVI